jgi:hypothetical protein
VQLDFVTGYQGCGCDPSYCEDPHGVCFSAHSSAHRVSVFWDPATWMWSLACSGAGLLSFSAKVGMAFCSRWSLSAVPHRAGRPFSDFGCSFNVINQVIF